MEAGHCRAANKASQKCVVRMPKRSPRPVVLKRQRKCHQNHRGFNYDDCVRDGCQGSFILSWVTQYCGVGYCMEGYKRSLPRAKLWRNHHHQGQSQARDECPTHIPYPEPYRIIANRFKDHHHGCRRPWSSLYRSAAAGGGAQRRCRGAYRAGLTRWKHCNPWVLERDAFSPARTGGRR